MRALQWIVATAALALLGACADPNWDAYLDGVAQHGSTAAPAEAPTGAAATTPQLQRDPARWRGQVTLPANRNTAAFIDDPRRLLGLGESQVSELLGAPIFVRVDRGAAIWQYHRDHCVLHVFLYALGTDGPSRVAHYELRDDADGLPITNQGAQRRCVTVLTAQRPA